MIAAKELIGSGLYTPSEAAFYARIHTQTINRWLFGNSQGERVVAPEVASSQDDRIVTFLDFVQALAIRAIRSLHKVRLQKIRDTVDLAVERGIPHPFAVQHTTFLFSDDQHRGHGELVLKVGDELIQASGKARKNLVMREIAELYMEDLFFDPTTGLASQYTALSGKGDRVIVMDPRRRFGEPIVDPCGITAQTLWEAYEIEGGLEQAATAYDIEREDVALACRYYDYLISNTAA